MTSCSNKENFGAKEITLHDEPYPATFVKEKEVIVEALTKRSIPHFARVDDKNHIYIKFRNGDGNHEIWKYNASCELLKKFMFKYGQGPQEAIKPIILGGTPDRIVIYDITYRRLLFWNSIVDNCVMEKRSLITHEFPSNGFGYSPKHRCALIWEEIDPPPGVKTKINVYLKNVNKESAGERKLHELEYTFFNRDVNGNFNYWPSRPFHCIMLKDFVFLVNLKDYVLYKYDLMGTLLKKVKVGFHHKRFSAHQLKEWERSYEVKKSDLHFPGELWPACWLISLDSGFIVGRREDYSSSNKNWICADYYDISLQYMGKIKMPWFERWNDPFYCQTNADLKILGKDKYLYLIEEDEEGNGDYVLRRWRFTREKR